MSAKNKPLILVDGSSYIYRAFHALPALTNSRGFPTGAIYGFINMLKKLMTDYQPQFIAVVFDTKGKTFRSEIYAEYKATRSEMPDELTSQIEPIYDIVAALGVPIIAIEGVEADDVIGTLVEHAKAAGIKTIISTGDKDFAQLVNDDVTLINTMTNVILDIPGVLQKFGVSPERIIDYLTLVGDTSDNIPGIPLVGPKTAAKWIQTYGSLENIVAKADSIGGKVGENLRAHLHQLPLAQSLVTIKKDIELPLDFYNLELKKADKATLIKLYQEFEFKAWLAELLAEAAKLKPDENVNYQCVLTEKDLQSWIKKIEQAKQFSFNVITSQQLPRAKCIGFTFAILKTKNVVEACYIPFAYDLLSKEKLLTKNVVLKHVASLLNKPNQNIIVHHLKRILATLVNEEIIFNANYIDVMLESYLLDSASSAHDLETMALKYLGWRLTPYEEVVGKGNKQLSFEQIDLHAATQYAAETAEVLLHLHEHLWPRLKKDKKIVEVFKNIELPLATVLAHMENTGVLVDSKKLIEQGKLLQKRLDELEQEAYTEAGQSFNMNSPKQLQEILFQKLQLPILQKTPKGQPSTADAVLQELALSYNLPKLIIEYRSLSKLISTYTTPLVQQINPQTLRVHTTYNQTGTSTGRLSSSDPNLQNIPVRTVEGRRIRQAFVARQGYRIVSADYSQIELRLMAHISQDPSLLKAFQQNLDIHVATAAEVWDIEITAVSSDLRRSAKAINFGLIYGMSAFGLTRQLGIERKAAEEYITRYFSRYPKVQQYMEKTREKARRNGYVETLWGRKLYIPDINARQIPRQKAAERAAINAPLQGSAADIIKLAMIAIDQWLIKENIPAHMIMQVHDELVFEVREDLVDEFVVSIREFMSNIIQLDVPLIVDVGIGDNWDDASAH